MARNKNHHFVPKAHLKPFSVEGRGKSIHLINIERELFVEGASCKGQCSSNYFYGPDDRIDTSLGFLETRYGVIIQKLTAGETPKGDDIELLRLFALVQFCRTEAMVHFTQTAIAGGHDLTFVGDWAQYRPPHRANWQASLSALSIAFSCFDYIRDLKLCIFRNKSRTEFVTSDNPAVVANMWLWRQCQSHNFGFASSGAMLFLPLSPTMEMCLYDGATYVCPGRHEIYKTLRNDQEVRAINDLQILNAHKNVYFSNWSSRHLLLDAVKEGKELRPDNNAALAAFVRDDAGRDLAYEGRRYRLATEEEKARPMQKIVSLNRVLPVPRRWASAFQIRPNPRVFSNGSAAGYVRAPHFSRRSRST
ncbi:MAG: DUF4238 domain-containing protein [Tistlia sp.]|uniref:DUF4238 domain-containing protein n=1 Tax=Tistlia sp. TaxID=3057121 RepID=UPI0034A1EB79